LRRTTCQVCDRKVGSTIEQCDLCGKWACPDCLGEADCCFDDDDGPMTAPPGWRVKEITDNAITYERIFE